MRVLGILVLGLLPSFAHAGPMHRLARIVQRDNLRVKATVNNIFQKARGYRELFGHTFPVRHYQEPVSEALWRGSRLEAGGLADLKSRKFSAVIGLTAERDLDADASRFGLPHLNIPIIDNDTPTFAQVKTFLDFVKTHEADGPVFVHCEAAWVAPASWSPPTA